MGKTVKESKTKQSTKEHVEKKRKHMLKKQVGVGSAGTQDDATPAQSNNVVAKDHVAGNKEETQPVERDVELEQQRMMNRVFNCLNLCQSTLPSPSMSYTLSPRTPPSPPRPPPRPPAPQSLLPPQTTALSTGRTWRARPAAWWRWWTTSS